MTRRGGQGEAIIAWAAWLALLGVVVVTYARLPLADLYRVSHGGLAGGLGRGVVLSNYPIALVAIALVLLAVDALSVSAWWIAAPAIALCAATVVTVDPGDLDVRPVNVVPAAGVLLAVALTIAAARRCGIGIVPRLPGDPVRIVVAVIVAVLSLPWIAADLGFHLPGSVFLAGRIVTEGVETLPAVHLGHHHGMDGALLFLTAVLLSRARPTGRRVRVALTAYLGLMAAYGLMNASEDFWHEQVAKRGWVHARLPAAQVPSVSWVWLVIMGLAAVMYAVFSYEQRLVGPGGVERATSPPSPARP
jgi:hypothetical protein